MTGNKFLIISKIQIRYKQKILNTKQRLKKQDSSYQLENLESAIAKLNKKTGKEKVWNYLKFVSN